MSVCWECDRLVSRMFGHASGCSTPTALEEPAELPGPVEYSLILSCGHEVPSYTKRRVGARISCWLGKRVPGHCKAIQRVAGIRVITSGTNYPVGVARLPVREYTGEPTKEHVTVRSLNKEAVMPRGARAAQPETVEEEVDYREYATKPITSTMSGFSDWLVQEVFDGDEAAFKKASSERIVALAGTLRMEYQRSPMNQERRAQARSERESAASQPKEPSPPARAPRGRKAAAAEPAAPAAKPARTADTPATRPARPARRGKVPAGTAAPF